MSVFDDMRDEAFDKLEHAKSVVHDSGYDALEIIKNQPADAAILIGMGAVPTALFFAAVILFG